MLGFVENQPITELQLQKMHHLSALIRCLSGPVCFLGRIGAIGLPHTVSSTSKYVGYLKSSLHFHITWQERHKCCSNLSISYIGIMLLVLWFLCLHVVSLVNEAMLLKTNMDVTLAEKLLLQRTYCRQSWSKCFYKNIAIESQFIGKSLWIVNVKCMELL